MIKSSTPVFAVANILETIAYYRDVLGFTPQGQGKGPPTVGCVELGKARIYLRLDPGLAARMEGVTHVLEAEDVDALYELHCSTGASIIAPLKNEPWGTRDYTLRDLAGYHLRITGRQKYEKPAAAETSFAPDVRIVVALPSIDQYAALFESVGWGVDRERMISALRATVFGVLALSGGGEAAGMARVTGDGMYFMVWDVIVRPSYQGHGIGVALLESALNELRSHARPGAFIGLFTGKHSFYERLGFTTALAMHRSPFP